MSGKHRLMAALSADRSKHCNGKSATGVPITP